MPNIGCSKLMKWKDFLLFSILSSSFFNWFKFMWAIDDWNERLVKVLTGLIFSAALAVQNRNRVTCLHRNQYERDSVWPPDVSGGIFRAQRRGEFWFLLPRRPISEQHILSQFSVLPKTCHLSLSSPPMWGLLCGPRGLGLHDLGAPDRGERSFFPLQPCGDG